MKKIIKLCLLVLVCTLSLVLLTSCSITQSYADKINEAAEKEEHMTYEEISKKLGEPTFDLRLLGNGACTWISGVSAAEYEELIADAFKNGDSSAEEKLNGKSSITVVFASGKATSATYSKYEKESK